MATSIAEGNIPRSFGAFYPTGHVVIFFANKGDAERAREALLTGGYEEGEITNRQGQSQTTFVVSHELSLDDAPDAYKHFDAREDGWTKLVLNPMI